MWLPGHTAKAFRVNVVGVLSRYLSGDMTLLKEIETNNVLGSSAACETFITSNVVDIKRKLDQNALITMPNTSWIYGTRSDAFPGLIKIGRSKDVKKGSLAEIRFAHLSLTF